MSSAELSAGCYEDLVRTLAFVPGAQRPEELQVTKPEHNANWVKSYQTLYKLSRGTTTPLQLYSAIKNAI